MQKNASVSQILFSSEIPLTIWSKFNYNIDQLCLDDTENIKVLQIMGFYEIKRISNCHEPNWKSSVFIFSQMAVQYREEYSFVDVILHYNYFFSLFVGHFSSRNLFSTW